jgi:hypothetical protein
MDNTTVAYTPLVVPLEINSIRALSATELYPKFRRTFALRKMPYWVPSATIKPIPLLGLNHFTTPQSLRSVSGITLPPRIDLT